MSTLAQCHTLNLVRLRQGDAKAQKSRLVLVQQLRAMRRAIGGMSQSMLVAGFSRTMGTFNLTPRRMSLADTYMVLLPNFNLAVSLTLKSGKPNKF